MDKSYENFQDDFLKLKEKYPEISYGKIAHELDVSDAYAYNLPNRRRASFVPMKMIEKISKVFHVKPGYFYEYRLQKALGYIDKDRDFLDVVERAIRKNRSPGYQKSSSTSDTEKESLENEDENAKEQSA